MTPRLSSSAKQAFATATSSESNQVSYPANRSISVWSASGASFTTELSLSLRNFSFVAREASAGRALVSSDTVTVAADEIALRDLSDERLPLVPAQRCDGRDLRGGIEVIELKGGRMTCVSAVHTTTAFERNESELSLQAGFALLLLVR
jgi:hypothetical protein